MANLNFQKNRIVCSFRKDVNKVAPRNRSFHKMMMQTMYNSGDKIEKVYYFRVKNLEEFKF